MSFCRQFKEGCIVNRMMTLAALAGLLIVMSGSPALATSFTIDASLRGGASPSVMFPASATTDYSVGWCGHEDCLFPREERNFFQFVIPVLDGPVVDATLILDTGNVGGLRCPASGPCVYQPATHSLNYEVTSLPAGFTFTDMGTGTLYGTRTYTAADTLTRQSISLDAAAIAAITSGTTFGIGGRVTNLVESPDFNVPSELIFLGTSDGDPYCPGSPASHCVSELRITTVPAAVLEPSTLLLLLGSGLVGAYRWRKHVRGAE